MERDHERRSAWHRHARTDPSNAVEGSGRPAQTLPPPPPSPRHGVLGTVWAIAGIVAGLAFLIVPGVLAIRSYRRWRAGSIRRPTFAWTCAWIGVPTLAFSIYSTWALSHLPLLQDDFSDVASGWPVDEHIDGSVGYEGGAYRIEGRGSDAHGVFVIWREGALPNVAVKTDVRLHAGDRATAAAGVGCIGGREGAGYVFLLGFGGEFAIGRFDAAGETLVTGHLPDEVQTRGSSTIRGECRGGFGETELTMYVNDEKVAEATDTNDEGYRSFTAIRLVAVSGDATPFDVRFDNAYVIGIQPS